MVHARVGGANCCVEAVGGHLVGATCLLVLFGGRRRRKVGLGSSFELRLRRGSYSRLRLGGSCGWRRGSVLFFLRRRIRVGARFAVHREFAAIGDDERFILFWHVFRLFQFQMRRAKLTVQRRKKEGRLGWRFRRGSEWEDCDPALRAGCNRGPAGYFRGPMHTEEWRRRWLVRRLACHLLRAWCWELRAVLFQAGRR